MTAVAVMGQLYQVETGKRFMEPDALFMLLLIFATIGLLYVFAEQ